MHLENMVLDLILFISLNLIIKCFCNFSGPADEVVDKSLMRFFLLFYINVYIVALWVVFVCVSLAIMCFVSIFHRYMSIINI